jgi:AhpD family alkylhydroperoxidase
MATVKLLSDAEAAPAARAVFDDIRATRGTDYVNNFWRALAHDPPLLEATWAWVKAVMAPGTLDPLVKEMVYIAVSAANGCSYCVHSHTAGAKAKGMTPEQHRELLAVISLAMQTNGLVNGLQVEVDEVFRAEVEAIEADDDAFEPEVDDLQAEEDALVAQADAFEAEGGDIRLEGDAFEAEGETSLLEDEAVEAEDEVYPGEKQGVPPESETRPAERESFQAEHDDFRPESDDLSAEGDDLPAEDDDFRRRRED